MKQYPYIGTLRSTGRRLYSCPDCGAVVEDCDQHNISHDSKAPVKSECQRTENPEDGSWYALL